MDTEIKVNLICIGILLVLLFILRMINATGWNNGYCSCGGKWVYQQAVGHRYDTTYLYAFQDLIEILKQIRDELKELNKNLSK